MHDIVISWKEILLTELMSVPVLSSLHLSKSKADSWSGAVLAGG